MSLICPRCLTPIASDGPVVYVGAEKRVLHPFCYERSSRKVELSDAPAGPGASPTPPMTGRARDASDDSGAREGLVGRLRLSHRTLVSR